MILVQILNKCYIAMLAPEFEDLLYGCCEFEFCVRVLFKVECHFSYENIPPPL